MDDMIGNGYAEKCKIEGKEGRCWYLPHHGVYHPQKPGKIRVVFDCSAQYANKSINTDLMSEPDLANQIIDVLLKVVPAIFYQICIFSPNDSSLINMNNLFYFI